MWFRVFFEYIFTDFLANLTDLLIVFWKNWKQKLEQA